MKKDVSKKITWFVLVCCVLAFQQGITQTHKTKGAGTKGSASKSAGVMTTMTVVSIAPAGKGSDYIKVLFTTNQVFKLSPKANPAYIKRLQESMNKKMPVYIKRSSEQSDMIQSVIVPGIPGQKPKKKK